MNKEMHSKWATVTMVKAKRSEIPQIMIRKWSAMEGFFLSLFDLIFKWFSQFATHSAPCATKIPK